MQDIIQFAINHWFLVSVFVVLLLLLFVEEARSKGMMGRVSPQQAIQLINRSQAVVIDIRDQVAYQKGHIVDSVNIPRAQLEKDLTQVEKYQKQPIVLVCVQGQAAGSMLDKLRRRKFENVHVLAGGIQAWKNAQMPLVKK